MKIWKKILLGLLSVNVPIVIMMIGLPIVIIKYSLNKESIIGIFIAIVVFIMSIYLSWLWWGIVIVKWKIYSYKNTDVDNWKKLYNLSLKTYLSWPVDSIYNKYEKWGVGELLIRDAINSKILEELEFERLKYDYDLSSYQKYNLNKTDSIISLLSLSLFLACVVYLTVSFENIFILLLFVIVILISWNELSRYKVLFLKQGSIELTNEYIRINAYDVSTYRWIELDNVEMRFGKIGYQLELTQNEKVKIIDLSMYKIQDQVEFWRQVEVYIDRAYGEYNFR